MKKLTIITINKNNKFGLKRTHRSIISQTDRNFTWIVIDGNSNDGSLEAVKNDADIMVCEDDDGIYYAMNKGLGIVKDSFVIFLNSGDEFFGRDRVAVLNQYIKRHDENTIFYSDIIISGKNKDRIWRAGNFRKYKLYLGWHPPHPGFMFHSSVIKEFQTTFDTNFKIAADYHFMLSLLFLNEIKVEYLRIYTVKMESGGVSNSSFKNILNANLECAQSWRTFLKIPAYWIVFTKPLQKILQFRRKPQNEEQHYLHTN